MLTTTLMLVLTLLAATQLFTAPKALSASLLRNKAGVRALTLLLLALLMISFTPRAFTGTWTQGPPMPTAKDNFAAVAYGGRIYTFGGSSTVHPLAPEGPQPLASVEMYDPISAAWSTKTPMPTAKNIVYAAVIGDKVYVLGTGIRSWEIGSIAFYQYSPIDDHWAALTPPPVSTLGQAGYGVVDDVLYVAYGSGGPVGNWLYAYNPSTASWTKKTATVFPLDRSIESIAVIGGKLYIIGGVESKAYPGEISRIDVYDPVTDSWQIGGAASMPGARGRLSPSTPVISGKAYVVGGWYGDSQQSTVFVYDSATNTWSSEANMPTARYDLACVALGSKIYALGGLPGEAGNSKAVNEILETAPTTTATATVTRTVTTTSTITQTVTTTQTVTQPVTTTVTSTTTQTISQPTTVTATATVTQTSTTTATATITQTATQTVTVPTTTTTTYTTTQIVTHPVTTTTTSITTQTVTQPTTVTSTTTQTIVQPTTVTNTVTATSTTTSERTFTVTNTIVSPTMITQTTTVTQTAPPTTTTVTNTIVSPTMITQTTTVTQTAPPTTTTVTTTSTSTTTATATRTLTERTIETTTRTVSQPLTVTATSTETTTALIPTTVTSTLRETIERPITTTAIREITLPQATTTSTIATTITKRIGEESFIAAPDVALGISAALVTAAFIAAAVLRRR